MPEIKVPSNKRIGILANSRHCSKHLYETIRELAESKQFELFYLLNSNVDTRQGIFQKAATIVKTKGIRRFAALAFFKILTEMEHKLVSIYYPEAKLHKTLCSVDEFINNKTVTLSPRFSPSGLVVRYQDSDIEKIRSLKLDLIVRGNATGTLKGKILQAAQEGIISFHHGDNRWNRGSPPAFWEVFLRKPSTGFILQILNEELDGGDVVARGEVQTRRSYTENVVHLYNESYPVLAKVLQQYAKTHRLPSPEEPVPFSGPLFLVPSLPQSIIYGLRTGFAYLSLLFTRVVLRKSDRWGVAFVADSWRKAVLRKGVQIKNPRGHFFADPFVITRNERTVCYVEDYCYKEKKACITAVEILNKRQYQILGPVIEEPFHMSFPYLLEYKDELYMVPETKEANSIRLYKCTEFPLKWEYQQDLLTGIRVVDSMLFQHDSRWWLLTNQGKNDHSSQLFAYHSEDLLSDEWIPHEGNPLVFDSRFGRNGGLLKSECDSPIRVRQKQGFQRYGVAFTLAKITELTPASFKEEEIAKLSPDFFQGIECCHHLHSDGKYCVYDYARPQTATK